MIINGTRYRIFCFECIGSTKYKICEAYNHGLSRCHNREFADFVSYDKSKNYKLCGNHPICYREDCANIAELRGSRPDFRNWLCKGCKRTYCHEHIIRNTCSDCYTEREIKYYTAPIKDGLNETVIDGIGDVLLTILIEYVVGYRIVCSSGRGCYKDIVIKNEFEFKKEIQDRFYNKFWFCPNEVDEFAEKIYDDEGYIVCRECLDKGGRIYDDSDCSSVEDGDIGFDMVFRGC